MCGALVFASWRSQDRVGNASSPLHGPNVGREPELRRIPGPGQAGAVNVRLPFLFNRTRVVSSVRAPLPVGILARLLVSPRIARLKKRSGNKVSTLKRGV